MLKDYKVDAVTSPLEALNLVAKNNYTVILSDYQMPEMTGVDFFKKTLELSPTSKRILVSAFVDLVKGEELWNQAKVHRFLAKPFTAEDLIDVVENAFFESVMEEENEKLRKLALMDPLTGAANQRYFWDRLRAEFNRAQRFNRPMTVVLFDVDHFKEINDEKGHLDGDQALKNIAEVLMSETRQMDVVARYGGDEFALILPEIACEGAYPIAQRLREKVLARTGISLSGGMASIPPATNERELVMLADTLLLQVKKEAKGQIKK